VSDAKQILRVQPRQWTRSRCAAGLQLAGFFFVGLYVCLGAQPAAASPSAASEPVPAPFVSSSQVDTHTNQAAIRYKAGDYMEAANELNIAYSLQPQPVFLFNIAQAYRKARLSRAAKDMYQRFIAVAPTHVLAPEARGYIQDLLFRLRKK
jgi:tetratricopeptide (TPR) repeat protein